MVGRFACLPSVDSELTRVCLAGPPEVLTIYDRKTSTLLDVREMDEYDDDEVPLRTSLLARYGSSLCNILGAR